MKPVLVTGGAGYIGSHTAKALAKAGFYPVTIDNLSTGHSWAVKWGPLVKGDISDRRLLIRTMREHQIQAVIHFAASAEVGESMLDPYKYFRNNSFNSVTLLEAMREAGVRDIVFSSTCATYGTPERVPISEQEKQAPVNPYGESKLFVERAIGWYNEVHKTKSVALRYFNAAGADAAGEIGENHDPETHLIPRVIQAALGQAPAVRIMGTDYATPDGTAVRDYVHVADLADAHVQALEYLRQGGASTAINLGTAHGYSVREVVSAVERIGAPVPAIETGRRAGDPAMLVADNTRAKQVLGWKPRYTTIDSIVRTAWAWHKAQTVEVALEVAAGGDSASSSR